MDENKNRGIRDAGDLSLSERHQMIKEYLSGGYTKKEIWQKYTGKQEEHGGLLKWMRKYGYIDDEIKRRPTFISSVNYLPMDSKYDDLDKSQLQAKINELERQLQDAKLREEGYRTMIEIAENTFKIPIRKKSDTK
jgi:transposase